jgi:hypothetical protein
MWAAIALGWATAATAVPIKTKEAAAVLFNDGLRNCHSLVLPDLIFYLIERYLIDGFLN